jgi:hypothetical protein
MFDRRDDEVAAVHESSRRKPTASDLGDENH